MPKCEVQGCNQEASFIRDGRPICKFHEDEAKAGRKLDFIDLDPGPKRDLGSRDIR